MRNIGEVGGGLVGMIGHILQTPILWLAIGLYGFSTLLWLRVLSRYPVSAVYPMVAIGYLFVTIGGVLFLKEQVSVQAWIALAVICAGTLLLAAAPVQPSV
jgi:drug/metabolite transporter (DMT)-like permease